MISNLENSFCNEKSGLFVPSKNEGYNNPSIFMSRDRDIEQSKTNRSTYSESEPARKRKPTKDIVQDLHNDIYEKTKWGFPTTGKNLREDINYLNEENILDVLGEYRRIDQKKESLTKAIYREYGLDINERKNYLKLVFSQLIKNAKSKDLQTDNIQKHFDTALKSESLDKIENVFDEIIYLDKHEISCPNLKIDGFTMQGSKGDCWLLAVIDGLKRNKEGQKILNNLIKCDKEDNYIVNLYNEDGKQVDVKVSKKEVSKGYNFSSGDGDTRILEIATEKLIGNINGGSAQDAFHILTGSKNYDVRFVTDEKLRITDKEIDSYNDKTKMVFVSSFGSNESIKYHGKSKDGQNLMLQICHEYAVAGSDKHFVYIVNPYNTRAIMKVPRAIFKNFFDRISVCKL